MTRSQAVECIIYVIKIERLDPIKVPFHEIYTEARKLTIAQHEGEDNGEEDIEYEDWKQTQVLS